MLLKRQETTSNLRVASLSPGGCPKPPTKLVLDSHKPFNRISKSESPLSCQELSISSCHSLIMSQNFEIINIKQILSAITKVLMV